MSDPATTAPRGTSLTVGELRALRVRAECETDAEAATRLGVSIHTLRSHLRNARSRLGVRSTARALRETVA